MPAPSPGWPAIVVGAETAAQMAENIRLFRTPALTPAQAEAVAASLPGPLPEQLLNPALVAATAESLGMHPGRQSAVKSTC